ncbi:TonB-dependent receptor [Dyella jejuensis]|uniref:TonB-dependent receptor n=1 Tax=Dyella jejuensis TaxID=1432009 RepID=A0ABW8JH38_9GAMM
MARLVPLVVPWLGAGLMFAMAAAAAASPAVKTYSIAAGNLRDALDALAMQSDLQIVYSPPLAAGKNTHGIAGRFTAQEALRRLLSGTGLSWKAVNASTFILVPTPASLSAPVIKRAPEAPRTLDPVNVSGSLIGNAQIQAATPTSTITAAEIKARGFNSVAEALQNSVLATGSVQGPQVSGSFTQGAQPVSLFGLSPQFTLILVDGKPIADFGRLYNSTVNVTNVANLPIAMVDHIDIMPGGASSIYGSQAIGGVINIVTRHDWNGGDVSMRTGNYSDGGGANQRFSAVYGHAWKNFRLMAAAEFDNASPIWGYQRPLTVGTDSGPGGTAPASVQAGILDYGTASTFTGYPLGYLAPPDGCASGLFGGSTTQVHSTSPPGLYCGSQRLDGYTTYSNQNRGYSGMLKLDDRVTERVRLYADAMVNWQEQRWYPGVPDWFADDLPQGAIEDAATGHILYPEKFFAPEEMPEGVAGQMYRQDDLLYQADLGANGQWGDSGWNWDIYYLRSGDRTEVVEPLALSANIDAYFSRVLGPVVGVDPGTGFNLYNPDYKAFFQPLAPAQYASFMQGVGEFSNTWINDTRATLSDASLFALPGGDAGFAALLEGGNEAWYEPLNPLYMQDAVFEHAATGGGGQRAHTATAFEWNLPLWKTLALDLSGRYDHYALDRGSDNHKFTYKIGLEYHPLDHLLLRGNYTTSFKAPDLASIFLGPTDYYTTVVDYYACAMAHGSNCATAYQYGVKGTSLANPDLQPTVAESWTLGTVWSPLDQLDLSVDYLHIAIQNEVVQQSLDLLMRTDAQCLLGQLDPDSAACQAIIHPVSGQVQRANIDGPITGVTTYYANLSNEETSSVLGSARYRFAPTWLGSVIVQLDYADMLKHAYQMAPGELPINQLADPQYSDEFKSIVSGSLTWTGPDEQWTATLYGHRYGPSPNFIASNDGAGYPGAGRLSPWITFNGSVGYRLMRQLELSFLVNNIANKMPPNDPTFVSYPYFNNENYNIYGREVMLQADWTFNSRH